MMNELVLMCGPSGAGKSTYIKEHFNSNEAVIISRDAVRFSLLREGEDYFAHEKEVLQEFYNKIRKACLNSQIKTVVVDATNLTPKARKKVLRFAVGRKTIAYAFVKNHKTLMEQNAKRNGRAYVPEEAIMKQELAYQLPTVEEGFNVIYKIGDDF